MQMKDHKILAKFLAAKLGTNISKFYKNMFILGNIEPDMNPFTYLHGWFFGEKFHGHNYENILPVMRKLFDSLKKKEHFGMWEYYYLGKLIHYVADSFTFVHNKEYSGSIKEHRSYERELHEKFSSMIQKQKSAGKMRLAADSFVAIEILHGAYVLETGSIEKDCRYIIRAAELMLRHENGTAYFGEIIKKERLAG